MGFLVFIILTILTYQLKLETKLHHLFLQYVLCVNYLGEDFFHWLLAGIMVVLHSFMLLVLKWLVLLLELMYILVSFISHAVNILLTTIT